MVASLPASTVCRAAKSSEGLNRAGAAGACPPPGDVLVINRAMVVFKASCGRFNTKGSNRKTIVLSIPGRAGASARGSLLALKSCVHAFTKGSGGVPLWVSTLSMTRTSSMLPGGGS